MNEIEARALARHVRLMRLSMDTTGYYRDEYTEGRRCAGPGCQIEVYAHDIAEGRRADIYCTNCKPARLCSPDQLRSKLHDLRQRLGRK